MRQIKEILRQKILLGHTHRAIAASVGVSAGSVGDIVVRARRSALPPRRRSERPVASRRLAVWAVHSSPWALP